MSRIIAAWLSLALAAPSFAALKGAPESVPTQPAAQLPVSELPAVPSGVPQAAPSAAEALSIVEGAVAPQLQAIAQPGASAEASAGAGENSIRALQGAPAQAAPAAGGADDGPADAARYEAVRADLNLIAQRTGIVASLPRVTEAHFALLLRQAPSKTAIFADYDDTLDHYQAVASPETIAAIAAIKKAGKHVVINIVSDRPDVRSVDRGATIFESLSSLPVDVRAGLIVSAKKTGRIFRFDEAGEPKPIYQEPPMSADEKQKVRDAAAAVKAQLASLGTAMHDGSRNIPAEDLGDQSFGFMLRAGTPEPVVREVAALLERELSARGISERVIARFPKDPLNPPYAVFMRLDKSLAVRRVSELLKIRPEQALILGDSMFTPQWSKPQTVDAETAGAAARLGLDLNAAPVTLLGNDADRDMERALPGALTLSVGRTADPRMMNGFVTPGDGPEETRRILKAVAEGETALAPASSPAQAPAATPAPSAAMAPVVDSRLSYRLRRAFLSVAAGMLGASYSLPPAGPRLIAQLLQEAAIKQALLTDYDNTLAPTGQPLSAEAAELIAAGRKAGKLVAIVTDRPGLTAGPKGPTPVLNLLSSLSPEAKAGLILASKKDGTIAELGADGQPRLLVQEPAFDEAQKRKIEEASAAVLARLPSLGTAEKLHSLSPLDYSLVLRLGTPKDVVVVVARELEEQLRSRGLDYHVEPRIPKNSDLAPYVTFFKLDKSWASRYLAARFNLRTEDTVIVGDSMMPSAKEPEGAGWLGRRIASLAARLSGPRPDVASDADRDMERGLPGALTLSVGGALASDVPNGWVLGQGGPEMTARVLAALASSPAKADVDEYRALLRRRRMYDGWIGEHEASGRGKTELAAVLRWERDYMDGRIAELSGRVQKTVRRASESPVQTLLWILAILALIAFVPALVWLRMMFLP